MTEADSTFIEERIFTIRSVRVILDSDLAALYGVSTKRLNEQYRRNRKRFPRDFAFQLTAKESAALRSQIATSSAQTIDPRRLGVNRSQIATGSQKHRDPCLRPYAFTEHGALQAANILNSPDAIRMSVFVIRAFVKMREQLATNAAILKRLAEIDKTLLVHDSALRDLYHKLLPLLTPGAPAGQKTNRLSSLISNEWKIGDRRWKVGDNPPSIHRSRFSFRAPLSVALLPDN